MAEKTSPKLGAMVRAFFARVWAWCALRHFRVDGVDKLTAGHTWEQDNKGNTKLGEIVKALDNMTFARLLAPDVFKLIDKVTEDHAKTLKDWDKALRYLNMAREYLKRRAGSTVETKPALGKPSKADNDD